MRKSINVNRSITRFAVILSLYVVLNIIIAIPIAPNTTIRLGFVVATAYVLQNKNWKHGFSIGFVGNIIIDILLGYGIWLNWALGNAVFLALISLFSKKQFVLSIPITIIVYLLLGFSDIWIYQNKAGIVQAIIIIPAAIIQNWLGFKFSKHKIWNRINIK